MNIFAGALENPRSTMMGLLILGCLAVGIMYPGTEAICQKVVEVLIGLGFIATADAASLQNALKGLSGAMIRLNPKTIPIVLLIGLTALTFSGCETMKGLTGNPQAVPSFKESIDSIREACRDTEVQKRIEVLTDMQAVDTIKKICQAVE